ncbi:metal-dependent hydrolase [Legionella cincinnatiensis]|uniref:Integral membrane protein n=1 Tax=Legionella cincinnatiensis TaxID=28085 RepID=A0A378IFY0_9GAMM|nr:metal-dependent hydrolase [Legionella cincinnatiensis]KTC82727.1 integral membrane protein [Legionella cincinnatiensis]STX34158.1 membrane-bound metal-dependent hydrolase [Legionella cincinnatiensis]
MDPVTHAALGASCSQAILGKYSKHIPWKVGALAAMAPDLDIFIRFKNNPLSLELWHRNFTHSFLFIPLGGILVALFFLCFSRYRACWKVTVCAALVGYATHGLLDALTSYGTVLLWPMSYKRISWDIIAIVDPMFTIPLILGIAWSVIHQDQKGVRLGLLFAGTFLLFNSIQHQRALQSIQAFATQQKLRLTSIRAMPALASSFYWRVIAKNNHCLIIKEVHTPLLKRSSIMSVAQIPLFSNRSSASFTPGQQRDLALFSWFSDNYVVVAKQAPLILADGRYTLGNSPLYSLWGIEFLPRKEHITKLSSILLHEHCEY